MRSGNTPEKRRPAGNLFVAKRNRRRKAPLLPVDPWGADYADGRSIRVWSVKGSPNLVLSAYRRLANGRQVSSHDMLVSPESALAYAALILEKLLPELLDKPEMDGFVYEVNAALFKAGALGAKDPAGAEWNTNCGTE